MTATWLRDAFPKVASVISKLTASCHQSIELQHISQVRDYNVFTMKEGRHKKLLVSHLEEDSEEMWVAG